MQAAPVRRDDARRFERCSAAAALALLFCSPALNAQTKAFNAARKYQEAGQFIEAERYYRLALKVEPASVPALTNLGIVLARQGRYAEATSFYESALHLDPGSWAIRLNLAIAYIQSGACTKALPVLNTVTASQPTNNQARHLRAICELETGRFQEAARSFEILLPASDPSVLLGAATAYIKAGRLTEGKALLDTIVREHGETPGLQFALGLAALGVDNYEAAGTAFANTVRADPKNAEAWFYLGAVSFRQNEFGSAMRSWREAARLNPGHFGAVLALGAFLNSKGEYDQAERFLAQAAKIRPDMAAVQLELGKLALRKGALAEARRYFTSTTERDPNWKTASYLLATTLKRMGLNELAEAEFQRSRKLYEKENADLVHIALHGASVTVSETRK